MCLYILTDKNKEDDVAVAERVRRAASCEIEKTWRTAKRSGRRREERALQVAQTKADAPAFNQSALIWDYQGIMS